MKLNLTQILNKRTPAIDFDFQIDPDKVEDAPGIPEDIELCEGVTVKGRICDNDGYMTLTADVSVPYKTVCDRCLAPLSGTCEFPFHRIAVVSFSDSERIGIDEDDVLVIKEGGIDFDRDVLEELSLELPPYHLCDDDCPGLCSVCGKRLDGACVCKKEKEIDPRLESFKKLLDKMKE